MLISVGLLTSAGCKTATKAVVKGVILPNLQAKAEKQRRAYFDNPEHDFITELQEKGLAPAEIFAKDVENILLTVVFEQGADHDALFDAFYGVLNSETYPTAKDKYLGFIGSDELKKIVMPRLGKIKEYASFTPQDWDLVDSAVLQYYFDKVNGKSDPEGYARGRIKLVLDNL